MIIVGICRKSIKCLKALAFAPTCKIEDLLLGLKNIDEFDSQSDIYELTQSVIDKKSDFASSLLFAAHTGGVNWEIPKYILEGFEWLQKQ